MFLLIIIVLVLTVGNSVRVAKSDAESILTNAPQARIEFSGPTLNVQVASHENGPDEVLAKRSFHVVQVGTNFVYLRPMDVEAVSNDFNLHAVPIEDIESISYFQQ